MSKALCIAKETYLKEIVNNQISIFDLDISNFRLLDRPECETNLDWLQIIPYITIIDTDCKFFTYQRGKGSGEQRLLSKYSIGLGGHVEILPTPHLPILNVLVDETIRELEEEVSIHINGYISIIIKDRLLLCEYLYDDKDPTNAVHLGLNIVLRKEDVIFGNIEEDVIDNSDWIYYKDLKNYNLEEWSIKVLDYIYN